MCSFRMHSKVYIGIFLKILLAATTLLSCCNTPLSTQWCITWWKLKPQGEWTTHKNSPFHKALLLKKIKSTAQLHQIIAIAYHGKTHLQSKLSFLGGLILPTFFQGKTRYLNTQHSPGAQFRAMPQRVLEPALEPQGHRDPVTWSCYEAIQGIGWWKTGFKTSTDLHSLKLR